MSELAPEVPGIARRLICMAYDWLLLAAVMFAGLFGFLLLTQSISAQPWYRPLMQGYLFVIIMAYYLLHWVRGGQTLPMKTWRLKLESVSGGLPDMKQAVIRFLAASLCLVGVGIVWALFDRDRQFLHDRLAGTRIIYLGKEPG